MDSSFKPYFLLEEQRKLFYSVYNRLSFDYGVCYLSYFCENSSSNVRIAYTSNPDWQGEYIKKGLIQHCHLYKRAINLLGNSAENKVILPWETVPRLSKIEAEIDWFRYEKGIPRNGISFCEKNSSIREFIAIAPDRNDEKFLLRISEQLTQVKRKIFSLREIIKKSIEANKFYM